MNWDPHELTSSMKEISVFSDGACQLCHKKSFSRNLQSQAVQSIRSKTQFQSEHNIIIALIDVGFRNSTLHPAPWKLLERH